MKVVRQSLCPLVRAVRRVSVLIAALACVLFAMSVTPAVTRAQTYTPQLSADHTTWYIGELFNTNYPWFHLKNAGTGTAAYTLSVVCSGNISNCSVASPSPTLAPGATANVTVYYRSGPGNNQTGTMTLTASYGGYSTSRTLTIVPLSMTVEVSPQSASISTTSPSGTATFTVADLGNSSPVTYNLQVTCAPPVTSCSAPSTVTVYSGSPKQVTVSYAVNTTSGGGTTGYVKLRAYKQGDAILYESTGTLSVTVPANYQPQLTADHTTWYIEENINTNYPWFHLKNAGNAPVAYALSVACSGNISNCAVPSPSVTLAPGAAVDVRVAYTSGAGTNATGTMTLTASYGGYSASRGLTIVPLSSDVSVTPDAGTATMDPNTSGSATFTVAAVGNSSPVTYNLAAICTEPAYSCVPSVSTIQVAVGSPKTVTVAYKLHSGYGTGPGVVKLRAYVTYQNTFEDYGTYTITVRTHTVSVTPQYTSVQVPPGSNFNGGLNFTVTNRGTGTATYAFTPICTGAGVTGCALYPTTQSPFTLAPGASVTVFVSYHGGTEGANGTISLKAASTTAPEYQAIGTANAIGLSYTPVVTPDGTPVTLNSGVTQTVTFTVKNGGNSQASYTIKPNCSGQGAICGAVSKTAVTLDPGVSTTVTLTYTAGPPGTVGSAGILASSSYSSDSGSYAITINHVYGVSVSPSIASVSRTTGSTYTATFVVTSASSKDLSYSLSVACAGAGVTGCRLASASPVMIPAYGSATVTVSYTTGGPGTSGSVTLTATDGTRSASGTMSVTITPEARPSADLASVNSGEVIARDLCLTIGAGLDGAYECGDLRVAHPLPTVHTLNKSRTPVLLYNSQHATPFPLVAAIVTQPASGAVPDSVAADLVLNGSTTPVARGQWAGGDWATKKARRVAVGFDATGYGTGVYPYTLTVTNVYKGSGVRLSVSTTGSLIIVNRSTSPFGAGWWMAGLERLYFPTDTATRLWVGGDGSARVYRWVASNVWAAANVDRPDTLKRAGTEYTRYAEHGVRVVFSGTGLHVRTVNRLGHTTTFAYAGTSLATVDVPPASAALRYAFTYGNPNATLSSVNAAGRFVTVTNPTGGLVTSITDPDTTTVGFGYVSGTARMNKMLDKRGTASTFTYDAGRKLTQASTAMGASTPAILTTYTPLETRALGGGKTPADTAMVTSYSGPRSDVADTAAFYLNRFGSPVKILNTVGDSTVLQRGDARYPALVTSLRRPNGFTTLAEYDARGNLAKSTDLDPLGNGVNAMTLYTWDPVWDFVKSVTTPEGTKFVTSYDPSNGNRQWQEDGSGLTSRVTFRYYGTGSGASTGLVRAVQTPLGLIDSVAYDAVRGNVALTQSPRQVQTLREDDTYGRTTKVRTMADAGWTTFQTEVTEYDLMDRVTRTVSEGNQPFQQAIAEMDYDAEGNLATVRRSSYPDPKSIGTLETHSRYDAAGRLVASVAVDGHVDSTVYDPAGNVTSTVSRNGDVTIMQYDALNRLVRRSVPAKSYPRVTESYNQIYPRYQTPYDYPFYLPNDPTNFTIPADVATFEYDETGHVLRADNNAALVRRTYYPNGLLATDTLVIRSYDAQMTSDSASWGDTLALRYGLGYRYDRNGRRTALLHPAALTGNSTSETDYTYVPATGQLATIKDLQGNLFTFTYDADDRPVRTQYPGGIRDTTGYDGDGNVVRRMTFNTTPLDTLYYYRRDTLLTEELTRDVRGKVTNAITHGVLVTDTSGATYSALGHLIGTTRVNYYREILLGPNTIVDGQRIVNESFGLDGLGNLTDAVTTVQERSPGSSYWSSSGTGYLYQATTGRLIGRNGTSTETFSYDSAGNETRSTASYDLTHSYYDAAGKLRVVDQRTGNSSGSDSSWHYDEFFYDALGRLVQTRTRARCTGTYARQPYYNGIYQVLDGRCKSKIRRTVWDGDQVAWELQYNGADGVTIDRDVALDLPEITGKVSYIHAGGIDQPVGVLRYGYQSGNGYIAPYPTLVVPHYTWRGAAAYPTFANGAGAKCEDGSTTKCMAVYWPAMLPAYWQYPYTEVSWMGSVLDRQSSGSGLQYMRNRFYDPVTGRFTQEDPAGLAGGLNSYGYANGDPVNYSDPFGLCPIEKDGIPCTFKYIGGAQHVSSASLEVFLDLLAQEQNRMVLISSGDRDKGRNAAAGGAKASWHTQGKAADIRLDGLSHRQTAQRVMHSSVRAQANVRMIYHLPGSTHKEHVHVDLNSGIDLQEPPQPPSPHPHYEPLEAP